VATLGIFKARFQLLTPQRYIEATGTPVDLEMYETISVFGVGRQPTVGEKHVMVEPFFVAQFCNFGSSSQ